MFPIHSSKLRHMLLALACALLWPAAAGAAKSQPTIAYRMVAHEFRVEMTSLETPREETVSWSYPVFVGTDAQTVALNDWLRRTSLAVLLEMDKDDAQALPRLLQMPDEDIIAMLQTSASFGSTGVDKSVLRPDSALGNIRLFESYFENIGAVHLYHYTQSLLYDVQQGQPLKVASLFVTQADQKLAGLLQEVMEQEVNDSDISECSGLEFSWNYLGLLHPDMVSVTFPFSPATAACTGPFVIKGRKVRRLLKSPRDLKPAYTLTEVH